MVLEVKEDLSGERALSGHRTVFGLGDEEKWLGVFAGFIIVGS